MNIPNILTTIRFILIPVFIYVFYSGIENNILASIIIFIIAGITDWLDGYIARRFNMVTKWGTVLDPLADKLMLITVLFCFTDIGFLPVWVILIVGIKEISMIFGGIFLYYNGNKTVIPANRYGKIATFSFYIAILVRAFISNIFSLILVLLSVVLTLLAFINYVISFKKVNNELSS